MQIPGTNFDAAGFRDAIHFAMNMGLPSAPEDRATFRWLPEWHYNNPDTSGLPYSWDETPASELLREDVQIPVAIDFAARPAATTDTPVGQFDASRVTLTVLDEDYAQVEGAQLVLLGGNVYTIDFWAPPMGLFDVTIHTCYATAIDET